MGDEIKADYDQLEQIASRFSNQAQVVEQLLGTLRCSMENLKGGWIGRGSDAFFAEMNDEIVPAILRLQDALQQGSEVTRMIIDIMRRADEEASTLFCRAVPLAAIA